jgi:hypothetical protein
MRKSRSQLYNVAEKRLIASVGRPHVEEEDFAMRILLDTHCFLWFLTDDPRLSRQALTILQDTENDATPTSSSKNGSGGWGSYSTRR